MLNLKKNINIKHYPNKLNTKPKISSSILLKGLDSSKTNLEKWGDEYIRIAGLTFYNLDPLSESKIFKYFHQDNDLELLEGDVINIETAHTLNSSIGFNHDIVKSIKLEKQLEIENIANKILNKLNNNNSYVFTFLIELDPL